MKQLKTLFIGLLFAPLMIFAQSGPPAPGNGIYALIDTTYQVGTSTIGKSVARLTLKNPTATLYTAVQFRVFYDVAAFQSLDTATLLGTPTNLDLQYVDDPTNGAVTITLVYTGASSSYSLADGETFELTFNHVGAASFMALTSINDLTWTAPTGLSFPEYAAAQNGLDTTLNLYSYGGQWVRPELNFHGTFTNVTGTGAKNLTLALEKKPKTSGTWSTHDTYLTDNDGDFTFTEIIDTTYYDVRLAIKGDTLSVGNVITTADAELINQWVLGAQTPSAWDFYTADVNESDNITISDAYGVFGRIAGRFSEWPNSVEDVKFFTAAEYATITGTPTTNYTSTIPGVTNFYYDILPGDPDSVTFYVMVPGDANGTGYNMARVTPIEILIDPAPGVESQIYNVIDNQVEYDFPTNSIEVNIPRLSVESGNLVNIPVKILTNGEQLSALQFGLKYNPDLLSFSGVYATSAASKWLTYINVNNDQVDWGGFDKSNKQNLLNNGDEVITLQFVALVPQNDWDESPLWTTNKFAGNAASKDLEITPTNGVVQVFKMSPGNGDLLDSYTMILYPNPTASVVNIGFRVIEAGKASLRIYDLNGKLYMTVVENQFPEGSFQYQADLGTLSQGMYFATLVLENGKYLTKQIIKQN